eukprot:scaffold2803_cov347-Prasinococcus_capsulatus_cf.AAC.5
MPRTRSRGPCVLAARRSERTQAEDGRSGERARPQARRRTPFKESDRLWSSLNARSVCSLATQRVRWP